jgi:hypothetical protein
VDAADLAGVAVCEIGFYSGAIVVAASNARVISATYRRCHFYSIFVELQGANNVAISTSQLAAIDPDRIATPRVVVFNSIVACKRTILANAAIVAAFK